MAGGGRCELSGFCAGRGEVELGDGGFKASPLVSEGATEVGGGGATAGAAVTGGVGGITLGVAVIFLLIASLANDDCCACLRPS